MEGEWHSYAPDGREVLVRRRGELWLVRCGQSQAHSKNLDVALMQILFEFRPQASNLVGLPKRVHPALGGARRGDRRGAAVGLVRLPERVEGAGGEVALVEGRSCSGCQRGIAPPRQVG